MARSPESLQSGLDLLYKWESETPDKEFLRQPFGDRWEVLTYKESCDQIRRMATYLQRYPKGSHIGIFSKNCCHWVMADMAISLAGHVSVPFFPTLTENQLQEVLIKGDVDCLFVGKLDEWESRASGVPDSVDIIRFPTYPGNAEVSQGKAWEEILAENEPLQGNPVPNPEDTWTILFTSGTTGSPKGVVHDHASLGHLIRNELEYDDTGTGKMGPAQFFSFLPLNHVAERTAVELMCLLRGGTISFAESQDSFLKNLQDTRPTLFFAVPRIWTKFQSGILEKMPAQRLDLLLRIPILSSLVKKKIRKNLGLDRAQAIFSAAAPMPDALKIWYRRLGIDIRDVYGMTETNGPLTISPPDIKRTDTVGLPMGNADVKIHPETGEVLLYAPWNMKGYYKDPELTAQVLKEGWVHSGDQGKLSPEGYLKIIGRVKETFKSAKGKFIIPNPIELAFAENNLVEQVCVVGRGLPQPLILCTLSPSGLHATREELTATLLQSLQSINQKLPGYQRLKKVVVVDGEWSVENEVLTPTLKVKRRVISERYESRYAEWQSMDSEIVWERT